MSKSLLVVVLVLAAACKHQAQLVSDEKAVIATESGLTFGFVPSASGENWDLVECSSWELFHQVRSGEQYYVGQCSPLFAGLSGENMDALKVALEQDVANMQQLLSDEETDLQRRLQALYRIDGGDWEQVLIASNDSTINQDQDKFLDDYFYIKVRDYLVTMTMRIKMGEATDASEMPSILKDYGLNLAIANRCAHYLQKQLIFAGPCLIHTKKMFKHLAFTEIVAAKRMSTVVSFPQELMDLMTSAATQKLLAKLRDELEESAQNSQFKEAQIYDFFLHENGGDRKAAIRLMAVLFQDHTSKTQVSYTNWVYVEPSLRQVLAQNSLILHEIIDKYIEGHQEIAGFPGATDGAEKDRGYHLFVPAYLSIKMMEDGVPERYAVFLPFLFNITYELISDVYIDKFSKAISGQELDEMGKSIKEYSMKERIEMFFKTVMVQPLLADTSDMTFEDMYFGYLGPVIATGKTPRYRTFDEFKQGMLINYRAVIYSVFYDMINP